MSNHRNQNELDTVLSKITILNEGLNKEVSTDESLSESTHFGKSVILGRDSTLEEQCESIENTLMDVGTPDHVFASPFLPTRAGKSVVFMPDDQCGNPS